MFYNFEGTESIENSKFVEADIATINKSVNLKFQDVFERKEFHYEGISKYIKRKIKECIYLRSSVLTPICLC